MSTLSSASTRAEINAAYDDNASYQEDNSPAKAAIFVTACRLLIRITAKAGGQGAAQMASSIDLIRDEMNEAKGWLATHPVDSGSNGGIRHVSFEDARQ